MFYLFSLKVWIIFIALYLIYKFAKLIKKKKRNCDDDERKSIFDFCFLICKFSLLFYFLVMFKRQLMNLDYFARERIYERVVKIYFNEEYENIFKCARVFQLNRKVLFNCINKNAFKSMTI